MTLEKARGFRLAPSLGAFVLIVVFGVPAVEAQFPPQTLENLKVLPEDMDVRALIGVMRGFSMGLGVRCQHCHVGEASHGGLAIRHRGSR